MKINIPENPQITKKELLEVRHIPAMRYILEKIFGSRLDQQGITVDVNIGEKTDLNGIDFACPKCKQRLLRTCDNGKEQKVTCNSCASELVVSLNFSVELKSEVDLFMFDMR